MERRIGQGRVDGLDRYIGAARGSAKRAAALTQRLLAFSRRQTLDPKPADLNKVVAGMEELIRRSVGPGVQLEVLGAGGLWATKIDAPQLENALLNLCINGRDAMEPDGGRLTVETDNEWLDDRAARQRDLPARQYVSPYSAYLRRGQVGFLAWARAGGNLADRNAVRVHQHAAG